MGWVKGLSVKSPLYFDPTATENVPPPIMTQTLKSYCFIINKTRYPIHCFSVFLRNGPFLVYRISLCNFKLHAFRVVPWCGGVGGSRFGGGRLHLTIESTMVALLLDKPIVQWILSKSLMPGSDGMLIST